MLTMTVPLDEPAYVPSHCPFIPSDLVMTRRICFTPSLQSTGNLCGFNALPFGKPWRSIIETMS
jgi:hypothetical protein